MITRFTPALLAFLLLPLFTFSQTVTTIAANSGIDDDMILDNEGNIYGSNYAGSAVFKLAPDGTVSTFSGGFNTPNGLEFAPNGDLFMVDNQGNKIYRITPEGTSEAFIPNIINPSGIIYEYDSDTLLVTSYLGDRLVKISPDGNITNFLSGNGLNGPVGLAYDENNNLYISNFTDRKIFKLTPEGDFSLLAQIPVSGALGFIAYTNGYLYATLFSAHKIYRIDLDGNMIEWLGHSAGNLDGDASIARFNAPNGILASSTGDTLYVSDFNSKSVRMITNLAGTTANREQLLLEYDFQVSPNPAFESSTVNFSLPRNESVTISLFDNQGALVRTIEAGRQLLAGSHNYPLSLNTLPAGLYHCQLNVGGKIVLARKVMVYK